jgi:uncharacterized protein (DUF924 family)
MLRRALDDAKQPDESRIAQDWPWGAEHHRDIVRRFGRFPHRNPILGRESTNE